MNKIENEFDKKFPSYFPYVKSLAPFRLEGNKSNHLCETQRKLFSLQNLERLLTKGKPTGKLDIRPDFLCKTKCFASYSWIWAENRMYDKQLYDYVNLSSIQTCRPKPQTTCNKSIFTFTLTNTHTILTPFCTCTILVGAISSVWILTLSNFDTWMTVSIEHYNSNAYSPYQNANIYFLKVSFSYCLSLRVFQLNHTISWFATRQHRQRFQLEAAQFDLADFAVLCAFWFLSKFSIFTIKSYLFVVKLSWRRIKINVSWILSDSDFIRFFAVY